MFLPFVLLNSLTPLTILFDYFDCFVVLLRCSDYSDFRQFRSFLTLLTASFYHTKIGKSTRIFLFVSCFTTFFFIFIRNFSYLFVFPCIGPYRSVLVTPPTQVSSYCPWRMYSRYTDIKYRYTNSSTSACRCHRSNSEDPPR